MDKIVYQSVIEISKDSDLSRSLDRCISSGGWGRRKFIHQVIDANDQYVVIVNEYED